MAGSTQDIQMHELKDTASELNKLIKTLQQTMETANAREAALRRGLRFIPAWEWCRKSNPQNGIGSQMNNKSLLHVRWNCHTISFLFRNIRRRFYGTLKRGKHVITEDAIKKSIREQEESGK